MSIMEQIAENTVKRVQLLEDIDIIKVNQVDPLRKQIQEIDRSNRDLVCERNQETFDFQKDAV